MYWGRDNIHEEHTSVHIVMLHRWPELSLVKGVEPKFNYYTCKEQGVICSAKQ
jgi:hypothetical protein